MVFLNLACAVIFLWAGTAALATGRPNVWLAIAMAMFFHVLAFDRSTSLLTPSFPTLRIWRLRVRHGGFLIACGLATAGAVTFGGALGTVGVLAALLLGGWNLWILQVLAQAPTPSSQQVDGD